MRRFVCLAIALALAFSLAITVTAFAAEATDYQGTYVGSVRTSAGNDLGAWVQVYDLGNGRLKLIVKVGGGPKLPFEPKVTWNGPDSFTVSSTVYVPNFVGGFLGGDDTPLVDGSGTATFVRTGGGWSVSGNGSGEALGKSGSASGAGTKVSDDFVEPVLSSSAATTTAAAPANPVDKVLVGVAIAEKQPEVTEGEKVAAGGMSAAAVIAALILCMAIGASMSGSEFAELLLAE
jgi:hypothetical protein